MPTVPAEFLMPSSTFAPAYLNQDLAELRHRAAEALEVLRSCEVCPRDCHVNRLADRYAVCKTGRYARVSSFFPHFGEEDCLRGWYGSGTIFFAWCNLRCVFCFTPDVRVLTNHGMQRIEDLFLSGRSEVSSGDGFVRFPEDLRVWTRGGRLAPVSKVFCHDYEGEIVVIKPYGLPAIAATPEHAVFAAPSVGQKARSIPAGDLARGYYLLVPRPTVEEPSVELDLRKILQPHVGEFRRSTGRKVPLRVLQQAVATRASRRVTSAQLGSRFGYHPAYVRTLLSKMRCGIATDVPFHRNDLIERDGRIRFKTEHRPAIPVRLAMSADLARLLGYYCAEGHVTSSKSRVNSHLLVFSFGHHEGQLAERTQKLIQTIFGVEAAVRRRRTTITVEVGKASLALFFKSLCGSGALQKRVPAVLFGASAGTVRAFLEGYFEGDGTVLGSYLAANTVSPDLAFGLVGLLLGVGVFPYFYATPRTTHQRIQGRVVKQSETLYYVKCRRDAWSGEPCNSRVPYDEAAEAFWVPIRRIERIKYKGRVYNLEVDDPDHSYLANGLAVGNCQNFEISQLGEGRVVSPADLARMMFLLQDQGCHNINFVTPEHVVPEILEALPIAVDLGLRLPIVYNTSAYDSMHSLRLLDGIVDIYMPDFKFWDREMSRLYMKAPDYPEVARRTITEMHRQVGPLKVDEHGLARRGVLLRHLVMPGGIAGSREIFQWIAREVSVHTYINVMDQYYPAGRVGTDERYETINRRIQPHEFEEAVRAAQDAGLCRLDVRRVRSPRLLWAPA